MSRLDAFEASAIPDRLIEQGANFTVGLTKSLSRIATSGRPRRGLSLRTS